MRLIESLEQVRLAQELVLTIGTFDGVHLGHQHLLMELVAQAARSGRLSAVLTFHPHPRALLLPGLRPACLSTPEERAELIERLGIDLLVMLPFTPELASTPAIDFVRALHDRLRMRELWVGSDFAMGRGRKGDKDELERVAPVIGFTLRVVEPLCDSDIPISSTRIRQFLAQGEVREAARLLGRYYAVSAEVVPGARRGRSLGFRTANLRLSQYCASPTDGVYAVWVQANGQRHGGVANMGIRPSFDAGERLLEVHLLDFEGDLYGQAIQVAFVEHLRPERRFTDRAALIAQIHDDVERACSVLDTTIPGRDG